MKTMSRDVRAIVFAIVPGASALGLVAGLTDMGDALFSVLFVVGLAAVCTFGVALPMARERPRVGRGHPHT